MISSKSQWVSSCSAMTCHHFLGNIVKIVCCHVGSQRPVSSMFHTHATAECPIGLFICKTKFERITHLTQKFTAAATFPLCIKVTANDNRASFPKCWDQIMGSSFWKLIVMTPYKRTVITNKKKDWNLARESWQPVPPTTCSAPIFYTTFHPTMASIKSDFFPAFLDAACPAS